MLCSYTSYILDIFCSILADNLKINDSHPLISLMLIRDTLQHPLLLLLKDTN